MTALIEYLRDPENPLISQRENYDTKRNSLDPTIIEKLLKTNNAENRNLLQNIFSGSADTNNSLEVIINDPDTQITRYGPVNGKSKTAQGRKREKKT